MANIPYRVVVSQSGEQIPVLDRKAWLHLHVFDAKSDPDQGHKVHKICIFRSQYSTLIAPFLGLFKLHSSIQPQRSSHQPTLPHAPPTLKFPSLSGPNPQSQR